ncbi:glycosyltransferase [Polaromonas hydrogenivorans]|uniref:Glycosyltransferase n=1 Tax=Polaromonas hydrogenivorans TaxID=335476 RepID=A0AAU7LTJ8_9BURK
MGLNTDSIVNLKSDVDEIVFSVVIVGYKKVEMVLECINSIYQFNDIGKKLEIILVDNSPEHHVYDAVMNMFDSVIGIKNVNNGFGAGNNLGAMQAKGKYLLFLNPDTILIEPIFNFAIKKFDSNKDLGMFGVKMVSRNLSRNSSFYLVSGASILRSFFMKICNKLDFYLDKYMYVAGANMFVRRTDFFKCGLFDENIFMYYEEPDLTNRLHAIDRYTAYFKDKKIIHLEGGTGSGGELALRRRLDSAIYFNNKYSISPRNIFLREMRLNRLKLFIYKIFGFDVVNDIELNIKVLAEYLKKIDEDS